MESQRLLSGICEDLRTIINRLDHAASLVENQCVGIGSENYIARVR